METGTIISSLCRSVPNRVRLAPWREATLATILGATLVGAVDALVLFPVAGVGAGQGAKRHQPRHKAPVGVRFAGTDKLVHLIEAGEVVQRLRRGFTKCFKRPA